jgi:4-amino-4-deoxy-L-arabinose transferase-like glycosyltransferase
MNKPVGIDSPEGNSSMAAFAEDSHNPKNFFLNPKVYFSFFFFMNSFLAYGTDSLGMKFWGGCLGVLMPLVLIVGFKKNGSGGGKKIWETDSFPLSLDRWIPLLVLAVLVARLAGLTGLSTWPMPDDGTFFYYSLGLSQKWSWQFFFSQAQAPALFNWFLALFLKIFQPGLFSLWLFPALLSILTFLLGTLGARKYFSPSFAFLFLSMCSLDFWLLYAGRFCMPIGLFLLWESLVLVLLAYFLKTSSDKVRPYGAVILGLCVGLGFFVSPIWALMGLIVILPVAKGCPWNLPVGKKTFILFLIPLVLFALVFIWISVPEKNGLYVERILAFNPGMDWKKQWMDSAADLTALFWGTPWKFFYGPLWGGVLNPVSGSLFLCGIIACYQNRGNPFIQWIFLGFVFFFFPVFLTQNFEFFRVLGVWPFLMLVVTIGMQALLCAFPPKRRFTVAILILVASSAFDLYHLWGPYHRLWGTPCDQWSNLKSIESWKADQILKKTGTALGPGILLADLQTFVTDQTLPIADYSLDPGFQPGLSLPGAKWVAILLDAHFKPFLSARFPQGQWFWLGGNHMPGSGLMMALIPVDRENQPLLQSWLNADVLMSSVTREIMDQWWKGSQDPILKKLFNAYPALQGDRFLETCFWEKVLYHEKIAGDRQACLGAVQSGLERGYPLPPLLNDEGVLLMQRGSYAEAKEAFRKALHSGLNLTPAAENLKQLEQMEKK